MFTLAQLNHLWPNGDSRIPGLRAAIVETAPAAFAQYNAASPLVVAHFMAQFSHECGAGHEIIENLNYSAEGLINTWPSRFTRLGAAHYAHNPLLIADKVYNGRMGNRENTDDGYNFRGRGGSQLTGREAYERMAKITGLPLLDQPDLVFAPQTFMLCAVADAVEICGCLPYAKNDDLLHVTIHLNGGKIGLKERGDWLVKWKAALGVH